MAHIFLSGYCWIVVSDVAINVSLCAILVQYFGLLKTKLGQKEEKRVGRLETSSQVQPVERRGQVEDYNQNRKQPDRQGRKSRGELHANINVHKPEKHFS